MKRNAAFALIVMLTSLALALPAGKGMLKAQGVVDPCSSYVSLSPPSAPEMICPAGDGDLRYYASGWIITVTVRDASGTPIPDIPAEDIWLVECDATPDLALCSPAVWIADGPTDALGVTTFSTSGAAGGCTDGVAVVVQGDTIRGPLCGPEPTCASLLSTSPDINGDLAVDINDFVLFGLKYYQAPWYDTCLDFNRDGLLWLPDFAMFAGHYGHSCAAGSAKHVKDEGEQRRLSGINSTRTEEDHNSGSLLAQGERVPFIGVYFDSNYERNWSECPGTGVLDTLYVVAKNLDVVMSQGITGAEYLLDLDGPWLGFVGDYAESDLVLGSSESGISLAWSTPQDVSGPVLLQKVLVVWFCDDCTGGEQLVGEVTWHEESPSAYNRVSDEDYLTHGTSYFCEEVRLYICPDPPICDVSDTMIDFGAVPVGSTKDATVTFSNNDMFSFNVELFESCEHYSTAPTDTSWHLYPSGCFSPMGVDSLTVTVRFEPKAAGVLDCVIATGLCGDVTCTGVGLLEGCEVSPSSIDFGRVPVGGSKDTAFVILNIGNVPLDGSVSESSAHYRITSGAGPFSLAGGDSLTVGVSFEPDTSGIHRGLIEAGTSIGRRLVYSAAGLAGLHILDVGNPEAPTLIGTLDTENSYEVAVRGIYAYLADGGSGLRIIDVSDPTAPVEVGICDTPGSARGIDLSGDYAFIADHSSGLQIIDISDPENPELKTSYPGSECYDVVVSGNYAFISLGTNFAVIDVNDPLLPELEGSCTTPGNVYGVFVSGSYAYVGCRSAGLTIINISNPAAPTVEGNVDTPNNATGVHVSGDYAYVADGASSGVQVVDVSDPAAPVIAGAWNAPGNTQAVFVDGDYVYVGDEFSGVHVLDIYEPDNPDSVANIDPSGAARGLIVVPGADVTCVGFAGYAYGKIDSIDDVPGDQGGYVRINLTSSFYDFGEETELPIVSYQVWRRVDNPALLQALAADGAKTKEVRLPQVAGAVEGDVTLPDWPLVEWQGRYFMRPQTAPAADEFPPGTWESMRTVFATQQESYIINTTTIADSSGVEPTWSVYVVTTHTTTPSIWFICPPDSGYSVDNIAPAPPLSFAVAYNTGSGNQLTWDPSPEPDFQYYRVYRGDEEDFILAPGNLVHETATEGWTDPEYDGWDVHYKITAFDYAGNESDAASPGTTTGITEPRVPKTFALHQNVPNPFNPTTTIRYDVPAGGGQVTLRVYDVAGRMVRTLVNSVQTAGEKRVTWDARNDNGSRVATGVYFYRMTAPGFEVTKKMVMLQ